MFQQNFPAHGQVGVGDMGTHEPSSTKPGMKQCPLQVSLVGNRGVPLMSIGPKHLPVPSKLDGRTRDVSRPWWEMADFWLLAG